EGRVIYYELFDGEIVVSDADTTEDGIQAYASDRTSEVQNVPNEESMSFTVRTESETVEGETTPTHYLRITPTLDRGPRDRPRDENGDVIGTPLSTEDAGVDRAGRDTGNGYDFNYEWQYSPNGTDWQAIRDLDEDATARDLNRFSPDAEGRRLELPEGVQGGYVRLVVIYRDEGDLQGNQVVNRENRVDSDPVKIGKIAHVDAATTVTVQTTDLHIDASASGGTPLPMGVVPAGWTLQIGGLANPRDGRSTVEWEVGGMGRSSREMWTKVDEGTEYTVKAEDRGELRAIVTRYDADNGLVSKTTVGLPNGATLTPNMEPVFAQPGAHFVDLGKAPDANGKYMMLTGEIKLQSLFTDPEGGPLASFSVSAPVSGFGMITAASDQIQIRGNTLDLWHDLGTDQGGHPSSELGTGVANSRIAAEGDQLLLINEKTGEVEYHATQAQDHGSNNGDIPTSGPGTDGNGNWITVRVVGTDGGGEDSPGIIDASNPAGTAAAKEVNLRIDAAPTGFLVSNNNTIAKTHDLSTPADNGDMGTIDTVQTGTTPNTDRMSEKFGLYQPMDSDNVIIYTLREHNSDNGEEVGGTDARQTDARVVARIDVQDDNRPDHAYGQYSFTVDRDDLFEVVSVRGGNASQGELRLKTGQSLDFESLASYKELNPATGLAYRAGDPLPIELVVTATPADHPDGGDGHGAIRLSITVHVINVGETTDPHEDDVPGLEDIEGTGTLPAIGNDVGDMLADSTASGAEPVGDDTDTTDDTDADDGDDTGDADDDHDGGWWEAATLDDGLF
ncbi:MAG: hypothetical protein OXD00_09045, partial [Gammaproteobacteria bacterium]|nr:hypothetical protein [Gammaproteobacteria bacterium]